MAKYEVICEGPQGQATFWDGVDLRKKGAVIELDPEVVKVSATSMSLKPLDGAPVFDKSGKLVPKK